MAPESRNELIGILSEMRPWDNPGMSDVEWREINARAFDYCSPVKFDKEALYRFVDAFVIARREMAGPV